MDIHQVEKAHMCSGSESFTISPKNVTLKNGSIISCDNIKKARKYLTFLIVFSLLPIKTLGRKITIAIQNAANKICDGAKRLKGSGCIIFN